MPRTNRPHPMARILVALILCIGVTLLGLMLTSPDPVAATTSTSIRITTAPATGTTAPATTAPGSTGAGTTAPGTATTAATATTVAGAAAERLVVDLGDLFTATQESQLRQEAATLGARYQMDIVIVTTRDTRGKSPRDYADDYFDDNGYGVGPDRDGILFLLDYDNREAYISTSGKGIRYLTDQRIEQVLDAVFDGGLTRQDNFGAARAFLTRTADFLAAGIPSGQFNEPERPRSITAVEGLLGLLGAGGTGLGFFASTRHRYKGKPRPNIFEFRGNSIVDLGIATDNLVNTFVSTRHIPPPPPPSGGGFSGRSTTHTSSSGRTHGGGGRGF